MSCGVICRREIDDKPMPPLAAWLCVEQETDWIDKAFRGFLIFVCIINIPVLIAVALLAEFVL